MLQKRMGSSAPTDARGSRRGAGSSGRRVGGSTALTLLAFLTASLGAGGACKRRDPAPRIGEIPGIALVPATASALVGADLRELFASPVVVRAVERMFARDPGLRDELSALAVVCEIDVERDLESAILAWIPAGEETSGGDSLLIARGALSEGPLLTCLGRHLAAVGGRLESSERAGRIQYRAAGPGGRPLWVGFADGGILAVASSERALDAALGSGPKLADNAELSAWVARAGVSSTLWGAGRVPEEIGEGLERATGGTLGPPRALYGHLDLRPGFRASLSAEMPSQEDAKDLKALAIAQLSALGRGSDGLAHLASKFTAEVEENVARFSLALSERELMAMTSAIDIPAPDDKNPRPEPPLEGEQHDAQRDAASDDEAPIR